MKAPIIGILLSLSILTGPMLALEPEAITSLSRSDPEQLMLSLMVPKARYSLNDSIPIYGALYYPPSAPQMISLELYAGKRWLQKTGFILKPAEDTLSLTPKQNPLNNRTLQIDKYFTIQATDLGVGTHELKVLFREPNVSSTSDPIKIEIVP